MEISIRKEKLYKIIIWGCGDYGQKLYETIFNNWAELVELVGVADNSKMLKEKLKYGEKIFKSDIMNEKIHTVYSAKEISDLYKKKKIDGVIIGTSKLYYEEIAKQLLELNIPILELPKPNYISAENIAESKLTIGEEKTKVYLLRNAFIGIDNELGATWIYTKDSEVVKESFNYKGQMQTLIPTLPLIPDGGSVYIEEPVCVLSRHQTQNYWHFLYEVVDKIYALEKEHFSGKYMLYEKSYNKEITELMGIPSERIIWLKNDEKVTRYKCACIYCFEMIMGSDGKTTKYLYDWAKEIVTKKCNYEEKNSYAKRVFIKRIGTRRLEGIDDILDKYNFSVVIPEELSVLEQIKTFYYADIIISPHGANSSNVMFMRDGAAFIETFGKNYINPCCLEISEMKNIFYQMVVEPRFRNIDENTSLNRNDNYTVSKILLQIAIKNAIQSVENRERNRG